MWTARDWILRSTAELWIVSDPVGPADAVAVFGGGLADRPFAAAEYYRLGLVKKILVSNVYEGPAQQLGVVNSDTANTRAVLLKLGVPESAIETFGSGLRNTHQEALALRAWAQSADARALIVPTEIFSARRVRWVLRQVFSKDVGIIVPALDPPEYRRDNWWEYESGVVGFQNEVVKYIYYLGKY